MNFSAKIRPNSRIDREWRAQRCLGRQIYGVQFVMAGVEYVSQSQSLSPDAVAMLERHPDVELIMTGVVAAAGSDKPLSKVAGAPATPVTQADPAPSSAKTPPAPTSEATPPNSTS